MTKKLLILICVLCLSTSAFAVPNLQLYIPGGTFDASTETWIAPSAGTFEVWVLAGNLTSTKSIYDIGLVASLNPTDQATTGNITITSLDGGSVGSYNQNDFGWGTPPAGDPLPGHGIFPTWYVDQLVTAQTSTNSADWEDVYDMPTMGGPTTGQIFRFSIVSTFDFVHFDAYGYKSNDKRIFAPFSHDAQSGGDKTPPPGVPEPATMLLFGLGMAGAGISKKFRSKK